MVTGGPNTPQSAPLGKTVRDSPTLWAEVLAPYSGIPSSSASHEARAAYGLWVGPRQSCSFALRWTTLHRVPRVRLLKAYIYIWSSQGRDVDWLGPAQNTFLALRTAGLSILAFEVALSVTACKGCRMPRLRQESLKLLPEQLFSMTAATTLEGRPVSGLGVLLRQPAGLSTSAPPSNGTSVNPVSGKLQSQTT